MLLFLAKGGDAQELQKLSASERTKLEELESEGEAVARNAVSSPR